MAEQVSVASKERINVTFKPATAGAQKAVELSLKLLLIGVHPSPRRTQSRRSQADQHRQIASDEVLANQELQLMLSVPHRLQEEGDTEELAVQLHVNSLKGIDLTSLVEQVPELKRLMGCARLW